MTGEFLVVSFHEDKKGRLWELHTLVLYHTCQEKEEMIPVCQSKYVSLPGRRVSGTRVLVTVSGISILEVLLKVHTIGQDGAEGGTFVEACNLILISSKDVDETSELAHPDGWMDGWIDSLHTPQNDW